MAESIFKSTTRSIAHLADNAYNPNRSISFSKRALGATAGAFEDATLGRMGAVGRLISTQIRSGSQSSPLDRNLRTTQIKGSEIRGENVVSAISQSTRQMMGGLNVINKTFSQGNTFLNSKMKISNDNLIALKGLTEDTNINLREIYQLLDKQGYSTKGGSSGASMSGRTSDNTPERKSESLLSKAVSSALGLGETAVAGAAGAGTAGVMSKMLQRFKGGAGGMLQHVKGGVVTGAGVMGEMLQRVKGGAGGMLQHVKGGVVTGAGAMSGMLQHVKGGVVTAAGGLVSALKGTTRALLPLVKGGGPLAILTTLAAMKPYGDKIATDAGKWTYKNYTKPYIYDPILSMTGFNKNEGSDTFMKTSKSELWLQEILGENVRTSDNKDEKKKSRTLSFEADKITFEADKIKLDGFSLPDVPLGNEIKNSRSNLPSDYNNGDAPSSGGRISKGEVSPQDGVTPSLNPDGTIEPNNTGEFTEREQRVLEMIQKREGVSGKNGPDMILGDTNGTPGTSILGKPPKPISQMNLNELREWQTSMLNNPNNYWNSSAAGSGQFVRKTLFGKGGKGGGILNQMGIPEEDYGKTIFNKELQEKLTLRNFRDNVGDPNGDPTRWNQDAFGKQWQSFQFKPMNSRDTEWIRKASPEQKTTPGLLNSSNVPHLTGDSVTQKQDKMANIRKLALHEKLESDLQLLAKMNNAKFEVFSGGQHPKGTTNPRTGKFFPNTGSDRHDNGMSADGKWIVKDADGKERVLDMSNSKDISKYSKIVEDAAKLGFTGIGGDDHGYMGSTKMHLGYGDKQYWGAGGRRLNAPKWLKSSATKGWEDPFSEEQKKELIEKYKEKTPTPISPVNDHRISYLNDTQTIVRRPKVNSGKDLNTRSIGAAKKKYTPGPVTQNYISNNKDTKSTSGSKYPDSKDPIPAIDETFLKLFRKQYGI